MEFHKLTISDIQLETNDTITIYFNIPDELKQKYVFAAGQYLTLKEKINGSEIRRAYSICTAPNEQKIGITIKRVAGGRLSSFIHSNWKKGMVVEVGSPEGNFKVTTDHDKMRNHFFIAAGSGITPIMSMLKTILEDEPMSNCYLLYGSRSEDNIIFKESLESLSKKYDGQLKINFTLSNPSKIKEKGIFGMLKKPIVSWKGDTGRISKEKISSFIDQYIGNHKRENNFYLCGPGDLITTAEKELDKRGIAEDFIHREFFSTPLSEGQGKDGIASKIKVHLNGEVVEFTSDGKKPILDELIALKKNPPYSCTSGACSSCMAKVISGKVEMEVCFALDDADLANNLILTCQAKPVSSELEISYDV